MKLSKVKAFNETRDESESKSRSEQDSELFNNFKSQIESLESNLSKLQESVNNLTHILEVNILQPEVMTIKHTN